MTDPRVTALERDIEGRVLTPRDPAYDEARRVWNGMIDRRPLAIVRAASVADVAPVVNFAREQALTLAVRGGGHNVAGNGTVDGGLVLDLGGLKAIAVDPHARTVRAAPGVTLGDLDQQTQAHGLAVPAGVVSGTGLFGLTLGGGFGWLTRSHGLTIDKLLEADVVTADGSMAHASLTENADLFWGLRGGGGNFGVATSLTYAAIPLGPTVLSGNLFYRADKWRIALEAFARWTAELPDELTSIISFMNPPPEWELGRDPLMIIGFTWAAADPGPALRLLDDLRAQAAPDDEVVEPANWVEWQSQADSLFPKGSRAYWKNVPFDELSAASVDAILEHVAQLAPGSACDIHHMGGAMSQVDEDATAFPDRSTRYWLNIYGFWTDAADDDRRVAWTRSFHSSMQPQAGRGEYVNFLGSEGPLEEVRSLALAAYGPEKLTRLVELKRRYDPSNLFRLNHNISVD